MALHHIIDRRLTGKNKSIANRERFLRRYRNDIRRSVAEAVRDRGITEIESGKSISIPRKDISEPFFHHGTGGKREMVHPGNEEYLQGDRIQRPHTDSSDSTASEHGEDTDHFIFELTREEFMQYFFEDLELPRLIKTSLLSLPNWKNSRAGYTTEGVPNNIDIIRSLRTSLARRIALGVPLQSKLQSLEQHLKILENDTSINTAEHQEEIKRFTEEIYQLKGRLWRIPFIDPFDLRYVNRIRQPTPSSQAVMFCIMDVSGSMDEQRKDLAKRFFILLYLFLTRNYEHIDVVFIRHHTRADEVDEHTFFRSQESGGTVVSSALELMKTVIEERYPPEEWNIYSAQASDGDNWNDDSPKCKQLLEEYILPRTRFFSYIQVVAEEQNLWAEYAQLLLTHSHFAMKKVESATDIYPVFRELFEKQVQP